MSCPSSAKSRPIAAMAKLDRSMTLPLLGIFCALLVAVIGIRSRTNSRVQLVQQPMVGGSESKREGPWPDCLGMEAPECVRFIETYAEDLRGHVHIVPNDSMVTMDFNTQRVRVWVDESEIVTAIPKRG